MTDLLYIAPSVFPSRAANAVHVVLQVEAFSAQGTQVDLVAGTAAEEDEAMAAKIKETYGVAWRNVRLRTVPVRSGRAATLRIALASLFLVRRGQVVLSRNLYASFAIAVLLGRPLFFETHELETGWRKLLQRAIMRARRTTTVVISQKLAGFLAEHHGCAPARTLVLHDAARAGPPPWPREKRREELRRLIPETEGAWTGAAGYFGHLYAGRGIEIVEALAAARADVLFLVFGGDEAEIARRRAAAEGRKNLRFMGHAPHALAAQLMRCMDVLLMPYQESVAIGGRSGHDTARWMSPMKMFEYMASGGAILSSDLPVLREVLEDGRNALLVPPAQAEAWGAALDRLLRQDGALAMQLAVAAYADLKESYTWDKRAMALLQAARGRSCASL